MNKPNYKSFSPMEVADKAKNLFLEFLQRESYTIEFNDTSRFSIVGFENGELFLSLRCKPIDLKSTNSTGSTDSQCP